MKISNNWLKDFIKTELKTERIGEFLTDIGLEVEGIDQFESVKGSLEGIVVGKVLTCEKHPNADKLKKTTVDVGNGKVLNIVCGAPNVEAGQTVPVAVVGTKIYDKSGSFFEIKEAKIRGEVSQGMICAEDELGLSDDHGGIMVLDEEKYEVGKDFADYFELSNDEVFEIGLTPNRTDAMSHYGVARDLHAYLSTNQQKSKFEKLSSESLQSEDSHDFTLEVEDSELCPRYIGAVIRDVKVAESPDWLKNRLKAIGLNPINNIVDITNYILHGYGQPLHAFDADKIADKKVKVGLVKEGTKFTTLDGVERTLNGSEIIIKDGKDQPMCIAGVFGGAHSGVSSETSTIFLESAYFNPVAVRKAAKSHGLNTDASFRFERGVDPNITRTAITHAIKLIQELAEGKLTGELLEQYPKKIEDSYVILRFSKIEQILGTKIHREKVKEILKALDIQVLNEIQNGFEVSVPAYRADVTREIDVIEEILRIYGYNKIDAPQKISFTPVKLNAKDQDELENNWARSLQALGFNEVMNNSLTSVKDETDAVKLLNPLSGDLAFMRKSLLEGLLQNAVYNINRKNADIKFFEFGKIYHKKEQYLERKQLAMLVTGREVAENWLQPKSAVSFYNLKAYVKVLLEKLATDYTETALSDERFSDALTYEVKGKTLVRIGKVSPELLKEFDIDQDCFYAEVELEFAQELRSENELKFRDIPKFNTIRRDLALLIDKNIRYQDIYRTAKNNKSRFIKNINLFDVYEGKNLPEGKKSYAMSFELLNEEKTLEEKEISAVMDSLIKSFQKEFNAELRS
ncbi:MULTISPECIES: phenylalanine--tRNA ligase subunit beta [Chryseobacterium]|uniref:Phenylalanine--tRNA ligase beta subunit n=1 Tax=Chryseobacterium camelliae TaxID=1265445 RepID=A0ABU0TEN5_9FLAO|nr:MULTISPECIES: phenylalanine--tRNA ligase subunit beta [Chryseobacterium]MDT3406675.1 phenylalanyl-tRNA synthetase beta chain [Pseudacidovorax intermedius]MDQ1095527.1 phenylalanyl-tRNA synthetase beta chain [Chryseobacterium camelliae]MDQ1099464.1 phenylalanyl-tRNA synthetase beta chain [Chryseobacterium sp. SORGH_AS_1048]MDR6086810.1 phenylalanyl-tRNA synthetase beta chain [Chryseobacterium sp. SORGH_AS_0909]MDR6131183.1 phenylalanyl-tRNA synthetase beta chain [Chryseobacterium sp. SORGH_A